MGTNSRPSLRILPVATLLFAVAIALHARHRETETGLAKARPGPGGASALTLAPDLSFTDDSSSNFPIRGDDLADGRVATDRPTVIFFGTSHCWNTNREAERLVRLYRDRKDTARFLVVDLNHPSTDQRAVSALRSCDVPAEIGCRRVEPDVRSLKRLIVFACAMIAIGGAAARKSAVTTPSAPTFDVVMEEASIPMKDGVRLAADVWR